MVLPFLFAIAACAPDVISYPANPDKSTLLQRIELPATAATLLEGRLFAAAGNTLYYLDARTGCQRWTYQADAPIVNNILVASVQAGRYALLFADSSGQLYAVDMHTARTAYKVKLPAKPTGDLLYHDIRLYVPTETGVVAVFADRGTELWRAGVRPTAPLRIDPKRRLLFTGTESIHLDTQQRAPARSTQRSTTPEWLSRQGGLAVKRDGDALVVYTEAKPLPGSAAAPSPLPLSAAR